MDHPRSNVHTHTNFSDGRDSVEQMIEAAIERGFTSLGFSDHGALKIDTAAMRSEAAYREAVLAAKAKYADRIEIALGYEHDFAAENADLSHYEYLIESVHFLHKGDDYRPIDSSAAKLQVAIDDLYGGDPIAMSVDYYRDVCRSMEQYRPDVVGHIGLVTKFNEDGKMIDITNPVYREAAMSAFDCAAKLDTIVEINTGAMSRGYRSEPYPSLEQLKHLCSIGGRITITSDCHRAEWIDFAFPQAVSLAKCAGFKSVWLWDGGAFREKSLAAN